MDIRFVEKVQPQRTPRLVWSSADLTVFFPSMGEAISSGANWRSACLPDDLPAVHQHEAVLAQGESHRVEYRMLSADRKIVWLSETARPVPDLVAADRYDVVGLIEDITPLKLRQISLEVRKILLDAFTSSLEEEEKYRRILRGVLQACGWDFGLFCVPASDQQSLDVLISIAASRDIAPVVTSLAFSASPLKGQFIEKTQNGSSVWINQNHDARLFEAFAPGTLWAIPLASTGGVLQGIFLFGSELQIQPDVQFLEGLDDLPARIAFFLDQEELQKEYFSHIIRSEAFLSAIPDMILVLDRNGICTSRRGTSHPRLFSARSDFQNKSIEELFSEEISDRIRDTMQSTLKNGTIELFEIQVSDGKNTQCQSFEFRIVASSSSEIILLIRNVTERARLEALKTDFISRASHELRTPITTAILTAGLIQEGGDPAEIEEYWKILTSELERQRILLDRLLMVGRIESGNLKLKQTELHIPEVIKEAIKAISPLAEAKHIHIQIQMPVDLPSVMGDALSMQQVLGNLLSNAVKYSPPDSAITIRVDPVAFTPDDAKTEISGIQIMVQDRGIGIPEEDLPHLFQRFYRARNAVDQEISGSGIGLFIIKTILEGIGGSIRVESKENAGTTFFVCIPLKPEG